MSVSEDFSQPPPGKTEDKYEKQVRLFRRDIRELINQKMHKEALELAIKTYEEVYPEKVEDDDLMDLIKKEIIKLYNIFALKHLQKSETEMAKYYLDLCEKFPCRDYECYSITKNNLSCYYSSVGQYRNAKSIMSEVVNINMTKINSEIIREASDTTINPGQIDYSVLANDFSNLCALNNKVKYYDALIDGMNSLALHQVTQLFKNVGGQKSKINNGNNLMLSYYNLAVQQEFLKRNVDAKVSYSYCEKLAQKEKNFGSEHILFKKLKKRETYLKTAEGGQGNIGTGATSRRRYQESKSLEKVCRVNFQESFTHPEISTLKSEFHPYDSKIDRLLNKNEKLRSNPYYLSTTTNKFRSTSSTHFSRTKK